jgi:hypothetical protein
VGHELNFHFQSNEGVRAATSMVVCESCSFLLSKISDFLGRALIRFCLVILQDLDRAFWFLHRKAVSS